MKISNQKGTNSMIPSTNLQKQDITRPVNNTNGRNFDAITIKTDPNILENQKFIEKVTKSLSVEVKQPTSEEKIQALKESVQSGNYKIDIEAIASKILLSREY